MEFLDLLSELRTILRAMLRMGDRHWLARTCKALLEEDAWRSTRLPASWLSQLAVDEEQAPRLYPVRRRFFWMLHAEGVTEWPVSLALSDSDHQNPPPLFPGWTIGRFGWIGYIMLTADYGDPTYNDRFLSFRVTWPIIDDDRVYLDAPARFVLYLRLPRPHVTSEEPYQEDVLNFGLPLEPEDAWVEDAMRHLIKYLSVSSQ